MGEAWKKVREVLEWVFMPIVKLLIWLRITPNMLTIAGTAAHLVPAWYLLEGSYVTAGWALLAASAFDAFDGTVAKVAGQTSEFGAYLDSTMDRASEGIVFIAIAAHFADQGLPVDALAALVALVGSFLVSYSRARAEGLGVACDIGLATRVDRIFLLVASLIFGFLAFAVYLLAVLGPLTALQRILHTRKELAARE